MAKIEKVKLLDRRVNDLLKRYSDFDLDIVELETVDDKTMFWLRVYFCDELKQCNASARVNISINNDGLCKIHFFNDKWRHLTTENLLFMLFINKIEF